MVAWGGGGAHSMPSNVSCRPHYIDKMPIPCSSLKTKMMFFLENDVEFGVLFPLQGA